MATPTVVGNSTKIFNEGLARTLGVSVIDALRELGVSKSIVLFLVLFWFASYLTSPKKVRSNAPVQGYRSVFEPTFLLQTRFILGGKEIIHNAYKKMKDQPFVLRRYDVDFMVLPIKYLDEIRVIPNRKLSSRGAQVGNLVPEWNGLEFLIHSDLHIDVLKKKMNPDLYRYVDEAYEELVYGWTLDVPHTDDWTEVNMEYLMRQLVARMTAKVFMGNPVCRDPEWLKISVDFSIDLFKTSFTMKMFPPWTYGLLIWFLPQRYRAQRQLAATEKLVRQLMKGYQEFKTRKGKGEAITREEEEAHDTLFNWMMDHGSPSELEPREMAARQCVLTLASIHTTASTVASMLYELCDHPEWFPVMRDEVDNIVRDFGRPGANLEIGAKQWCARMDKLDSFFVESQRHNPVILLNPQRLANDPITLKDGVHIPAGTRLAFANYEHQMDPETIENPHAFDPMRSYRKRFQSSDPSQKTLHIAGLTNPNNLGFGYGNQACPGRYFAVAEIKLIMARLLYEFEFKLPEGKGKPVSKYVNENVFTDQSATIMMRKRKEAWV